MKKFSFFCLFTCLVSSVAVAQRSSFVSPLSLGKDGYMIDFGEKILDPVTSKNVKVDVALVDFSGLSKARTEADSVKLIEQIYRNPSRFSIVTGTLLYLTDATAKLLTKAKFKFSISDPKYTMVVVENNGKDNSGTSTAPGPFYLKKTNCRCKSCGCCCYRTPRGCTYCGIVLTK